MNQYRTFQIFIVCGLGAFIGALVALQLSPVFWWLGAIIGFSVGYLSYEPASLGLAARATWRKASESGLKSFNTFRQDALGWILMYLAATFTSVSYTAVMFFSVPPIKRQSSLLYGWLFGVFLLAVLVHSVVLVAAVGDDNKLLKGKALIRRSWVLARLSAPAVVLYWVPVVLWRVAKALPRVAVWTGGLIAFFFRMVHSNLRLLCGLDAALGACVGYFAGSALIGALVGGLFGLLNFELVSKRWLKLAS